MGWLDIDRLIEELSAAPAVVEGALEELVDELNGVEQKATVQRPGSRGGHYYIDAKGIVRYGTPPSKKPKAKKGKAAPKGRKGPDPAKAAAQRARQQMVTAQRNARSEVRDITSMDAAKKLGWSGAGDAAGGYADAAAANEAAREAGKAHPDQMVAVVKVGDQYQVVSKPVSALQGDRSNVSTVDAGSEAARQQREADRQQAAQQRQTEQNNRAAQRVLDRAARDQARADARTQREQARRERAAARETARQQREAQRAADRASKQTERNNRAAAKLLNKKSLEDDVELKEALKRDDIEAAMRADFAAEIADAYRAYAGDHDYDFAEHAAAVKELLDEYYPELFEVAYGDAKEAHGLKIAFDVKNPEVAKAINDLVGVSMKQISDTTRETLKDLVHVQTQAGLSTGQLAKLIREQGITDSKSRSELIARTESANAYNHGAIRAYRDAGIEEVDVTDGDGDTVCAEANGKRWTLDKATKEPIGHPGCRRSFSPVVVPE